VSPTTERALKVKCVAQGTDPKSFERDPKSGDKASASALMTHRIDILILENLTDWWLPAKMIRRIYEFADLLQNLSQARNTVPDNRASSATRVA